MQQSKEKKRPLDDEDDLPYQESARLAASVRGGAHRDYDYQNYIATKYPSFPSSSSSSSAAPTTMLTGADIKPGDTYVDIKELSNPSMRKNAPRADGYDPQNPKERRFGPSWRQNFDDRQRILESHTYYRALSMIAGHANQDLSRLISVESMIGRQTGEKSRQRITELHARIAEHNIEEQRRRLNELKNTEAQQMQSADRLAALNDQNASIRKMMESKQSNVSKLSSLQRLRDKYELVDSFFKACVSEVQSRRSPNVTDAAKKVFNFLPADRGRIIKDFLFGVELSRVEGILNDVKKINKFFVVKNPVNGFVALSSSERKNIGLFMGDVMEQWMNETQNIIGPFDLMPFVDSRSRLPSFDEGFIDLALMPRIIEVRMAEIADQLIDLETERNSDIGDLPFADERNFEQRRVRLLSAQKNLKEQSEKLETAPLVVTDQVIENFKDIRTKLKEYQSFDVGSITKDQFFASFGRETDPTDSSSKMIKEKITQTMILEARVEADIKDLDKNIKRIETEIASMKERTRLIVTLKKQIEIATKDVDDALGEIRDLETHLYKDTFAHQNQPWASGILDISPAAAAVLAQAHDIVKRMTNNNELTLHELMSDEKWLIGFTLLVGRMIQRNGMLSGSSYAQLEILEAKQQEIELIMDTYFRPSSSSSSSAFDDSRQTRSIMAIGSTNPTVGIEMERRSFGSRLQGLNPVSPFNTSVPIILTKAQRNYKRK
jgi:predicted nuclease with TOPRIM domain